MLQAMRSGTKSPLMKFFLLFLAGGFALWGIGDGSTGLIGGSDKAITAGKQSISPREVAIEFNRARRNYLPNTTIAEAIKGGLLNEVIGKLSREILFNAESDDLELTITRKMQREAIIKEASFQDEFGQFSEGRFLQVLSSAGYSELDYLKRVEDVLIRNQLVTPLAKGLRFSKELAEVIAAHELQKRIVKLSSFSVNPELVKLPNAATIDTFFQNNKSNYDLPTLRSAKIGTLSADLIGDSITFSEEDIRNAFDERLDEFSKPEIRNIRQMVFDNEAIAQTALKRLNKGEDFSEVANDLLNWTDSDTDLGEISETALDNDLSGPAFAADAGSIIGPLQTVFGYHLLLIDKITPGGTSKLDDVRDQITNALRNEQSLNLLYDKVNLLEDIIGSGATIEEAINKVGGQLNIVQDIDRQGRIINDEPVPDIIDLLLQDDTILKLIWDSELNEISVIQEGSDDVFFVVNVISETEQRERTLNEVKSRVVADYKLTKAIEQARASAEVVSDNLKSDSITYTSTAFRRNGIGLDHEAAGLIAKAAFSQKIGGISVIETESEAIALETIEIIPASTEELETTSRLVITAMNNALQDDMTNMILMSLSQKHDLQLNLPSVQQVLLGSPQ